MKKFILYFIFFLSTVFCYSQNEKTNFYLKASPVNMIDMIDMIMPCIRIGVEKKISKKLSLNLSFNRNINYLSHNTTINRSYSKGYRINSEVRFYPNKFFHYHYVKNLDSISTKTDFFKAYFACELFYLNSNQIKELRYGYKDRNPNKYKSEETINAKIYKQIIGFTIKYGWIHYYKNFMLDAYAGVGFRYKFIRNDAINPRKEETIYIDVNNQGNFWASNKSDGIYFTPSLSLGLNFGYLIKTKRK